MKTCVATLNESVLEIVTKAFARRTQTPPSETTNAHGSHDLVSLFMDHVDTLTTSERGGIEFNGAFFRDVVMNFFIAGRDTTAQALSWLFVELRSKPEIESKIRDEIKRVTPSLASGQSKTPAIDELPQLVYLEAVIRETLRLHPSVPIIPKYVAQDVVLSDGTLLRKGNSVSVSAYVMARMSFVWGDDAAEFKPDRWIDSTTGKLITVSQFKFPSFNAGPRLCLGMSLAIMEIKMVLVTLLSKFHLELEPDQNITYVNSVSLPVKGELLVRVRNAPLSL
jgi:cytochrome P450